MATAEGIRSIPARELGISENFENTTEKTATIADYETLKRSVKINGDKSTLFFLGAVMLTDINLSSKQEAPLILNAGVAAAALAFSLYYAIRRYQDQGKIKN